MKIKLLGLGLAMALAATPVFADTIELTGSVRDFRADHPDMQTAVALGVTGVIRGLVSDTIGEDGKPVYNPVRPSTDSITSASSFGQWFNDVPGVNITMPYTITLDNGQDKPGGVYTFAVERPNYFFPIDGKGWADTAVDKNGKVRNFYFTYEIHTTFTYTDPAGRDLPMVFRFTGDDDVWVFVNGQLVVDIGGVHGQAKDEVNLDDIADRLGLEPGQSYRLDFFFAERHTSESNFRIDTTIQFDGADQQAPTIVSPLYD